MSKQNDNNRKKAEEIRKSADEILRNIRIKNLRDRSEYVHYLDPDLIEPHVTSAPDYQKKLLQLENGHKTPNLVFVLNSEINAIKLLNQCHQRLEFSSDIDDLRDSATKMITVLMEFIPEDRVFSACEKMRDRFLV